MCGVIGIVSRSVATNIFYGLRALQHRGQESAGIATYNKEEGTKCIKGIGLVHEVFNEENLKVLEGIAGIGHTRYSTVGSSKLENAQPLIVSSVLGDIALAHNGDIVNAHMIREELKRKGWGFITTTDSEIILRLLANEFSTKPDIIEAIEKIMKIMSGSYSLTILLKDKVIGLRDPNGIKPLCIGKLEDGYMLASESVALDIVDAKFIRDVAPGEYVELSKDGFKSKIILKGDKAHCMFEWVYFARPDSTIDKVSVHNARKRIGVILAKEQPADADVVIPVPDSGRTHALGYAEEASIPYGEGLMKNRFIERTFIIPDEKKREATVKLKLNAIKPVISGKKIVLIDDSIVRGTTMKRIVQHIKEAGAKEVHVRIGSPPIIAPCYLGIDMKVKKQFAANERSVEEIKRIVNATSLGYLSIDGLVKAIGLKKNELCLGCLTGNYPVDVKDAKTKDIYEKS